MHPHDRKIQNTSHNLNITWRIGSIYQKINSLNQHESENINSSIGPLLKCQLINFSHFWMVYVLLQNWVLVAKLVAGGFERKESFAWSQTDPLYCCAMKQMYVYTNQHTAPHTSSDLSWNYELLMFVEEHTSIAEVFCMKALPVVRPSHCFKTEVCYKTMHFLP